MSVFEKENFCKIIKVSDNLSDTCLKLGIKNNCYNRNKVKKFIFEYKVEIPHFRTDFSKKKNNSCNYELSEILVENSSYSTQNLKKRLYGLGIKERICEICGQDEN